MDTVFIRKDALALATGPNLAHCFVGQLGLASPLTLERLGQTRVVGMLNVLTWCHKLHIRQPVVGLYTIFVVDLHSFRNRPIGRFPQEPMSQVPLACVENFDVSVPFDRPDWTAANANHNPISEIELKLHP